MKNKHRYVPLLAAAAALLLPVSALAAPFEGLSSYRTGNSSDDGSARYPVSETLTPGGIVELEGKDLEEGEFTFEVLDGDGQVIQTVTNTEEGGIAFEAITYTLDEPASEPLTYTYTVRQLDPEEEGVTIDSQVYTFTVKVTDLQDGTLELWASEGWNSLDFTNTWEDVPEQDDTARTAETAEPEETAADGTEDDSSGSSRGSSENSSAGSSSGKSAHTGDQARPALWLFISAAALASAGILLLPRKKR